LNGKTRNRKFGLPIVLTSKKDQSFCSLDSKHATMWIVCIITLVEIEGGKNLLRLGTHHLKMVYLRTQWWFWFKCKLASRTYDSSCGGS
jgi:hypothetical protein